ncbi:hypothetical protein BaRGS_00023142, partial [Batillaria attramentaria]
TGRKRILFTQKKRQQITSKLVRKGVTWRRLGRLDGSTVRRKRDFLFFLTSAASQSTTYTCAGRLKEEPIRLQGDGVFQESARSSSEQMTLRTPPLFHPSPSPRNTPSPYNSNRCRSCFVRGHHISSWFQWADDSQNTAPPPPSLHNTPSSCNPNRCRSCFVRCHQ